MADRFPWEDDLDSLRDIVSGEVDWKKEEADAACDRLESRFKELEHLVGKEYSDLTVDIDDEVLAKLEKIMEKTGFTLSEVVTYIMGERLISDALKEINKSE